MLLEDNLNINLSEDNLINTIKTRGNLGVKRKRQDNYKNRDQSFDNTIGKKAIEQNNIDNKSKIISISKEDVTIVAKEERAREEKDKIGSIGKEKPRRDVIEEGTKKVVVENDAESQKEVNSLLLQALDKIVEELEKKVINQREAAELPLKELETLLDLRCYLEAARNNSNVVIGRAAIIVTILNVILLNVYVNKVNSSKANLRGFLQRQRKKLVEEVKSITAILSALAKKTALALEGLVYNSSSCIDYAN